MMKKHGIKWVVLSAASDIVKSAPYAKLIFRSGSGNAANMTPIPEDYDGLSYSTVAILTANNLAVTSMNLVNGTLVLVAVDTPNPKNPFHVSVLPRDMRTLAGWQASRQVYLHPYTVLMMGISVRAW